MARLSSSPSPIPQQAASQHSSSFLLRVVKLIWKIITLPFRIGIIRTIVFAILLVVLFFVIRTGAWYPPVAGPLIYDEPTPLHQVDPTAFSSLQLTQRLAEAGVVSLLTKKEEVLISENELSGLMRQSFLDSTTWQASDSRVSISPTTIEIFVSPIKKPKMKIRVNVVPKVENDKLALKIISAKVGQVAVPQMFLPSSAVEALSPLLIDAKTIGGRVTGVTLSEKFIRISIEQ